MGDLISNLIKQDKQVSLFTGGSRSGKTRLVR
jgi:hypothetical protein